MAESLESVLVEVPNLTIADVTHVTDWREVTTEGGLIINSKNNDHVDLSTAMVGDSYSKVIGVVTFAFGSYKLWPLVME